MQRYLILGIFALSGAAGLIFEVVWARQLVLVFGNTSESISAILTGFFGGMALGSWQGGKVADRVPRPLRMYALLELALVAVVLLTPVSFRLIAELYRAFFSQLEQNTTALSLIRFVLALLALGPATIIMGATLPTLTRYLARTADGLNAAFSRLYLANTMGAVFGAAAAGLVLIELFGLTRTLIVGALGSAAAGFVALAIDKRTSRGALAPRSYIAPGERSGTDADRADVPIALFVAFVSGLTSLGYQVLWNRLLASGTGSSTYVFTLILTVFLAGLAAGAVEYKRQRQRITHLVELLAAGQIAIAVAVAAGMFAVVSLGADQLGLLLKTLVVVLPPTFLMGFTLPAASSLLAARANRTGELSGRLLGVNTAGAIVGSSLLPFVIIPAVGSPRAVALLAVANAATGAVLALRGGTAPPFRSRALATVACVVAILIGASVALPRPFVDPNVARITAAGDSVYRSREDKIASVQAGTLGTRKRLWVTGTSMTDLTVDAKLMAILPLMLRPDSESLLAVAFGMGSTYRSALVAGLTTDAVELVPSVPLMFDVFYSDARAAATHPRGRILIADGRSRRADRPHV